MKKIRPVVLIILDGWGESTEKAGNAIALAHTPNFDRLKKQGFFTTLKASESAVGLPKGQAGNSEVGHTVIGAGRKVKTDLKRINQEIKKLHKNPRIKDFADKIQKTGGNLHLAGLLSDGGVHSHIEHILALTKYFSDKKIPILLHLFLDGRDTLPGTAGGHLVSLLKETLVQHNTSLASLSGRFYAMDRDQNWERTKKAWEVMVLRKGEEEIQEKNIYKALNEYESEEFLVPMTVGKHSKFRKKDAFLIANFRTDRIQQLLEAIAIPGFAGFNVSKGKIPKNIASMTPLPAGLEHYVKYLFPKNIIKPTLGSCLSKKKLKQLRIAETEKFPHITRFLNGGRENPNTSEDWILVPSQKVQTHDLAPEMAAREISECLKKAIQEKKHDVIIVNFANPDMVGHTGNLEATIKAVEIVDQELGKAEEVLLENSGIGLVTSDHGNADCLVDSKTGKPHTAHTTAEVPCFLIGNIPENFAKLLGNGQLADIAPTILDLTGIPKPKEMTGKSLIIRNN